VRDVAAASPRRALAAWSAGCASGEEAYSLAATLLAVAAGRPIEVLGTDLSPRALARAAAGTYGRWSRRDAGPMLYPILAPGEGAGADVLRVSGELRRTVRLARHNLLDPPPAPAGGFDVVLCRNVFVYLRPDAARRVARHLSDALAEGGLLIVGNLGATEHLDDPALEPTGPRELGAYVRRPASPAVDPRPRRKTRETGPPPPGPTLTAQELAEHVAAHLRALHLLEASRLAEAEILLSGLVGAGGYVPALLELALLSERRGRPARAAELAARVLELLERRDPDAEVAGPEPLPVRYYTTIAHTFLARLRGRA
jgi:SAM-dependent methyltransferase